MKNKKAQPPPKATQAEKHKPTKLVNFANISQFANLKGVSRVAVYNHIRHSLIIPEYVGINSDPYIDLTRYKDYQFQTN